MAGRGRGNGLTLTREQLQALGIARGDKTTLKAAPPPLFPKLENKPLPLPVDASTEYMLVVKQQFLDHLLESPSYIKEQVKTTADEIERYSDKYKILSNDLKGSIVPCVWSHVPLELRPGKKVEPKKRKVAIKKDVESKLKKLEVLEMKEEVESDQEDGGDQDNQEELDLADEEEDHLDEGTDYGNNYFDNGEGFEDEDDNLDDGPVY